MNILNDYGLFDCGRLTARLITGWLAVTSACGYARPDDVPEPGEAPLEVVFTEPAPNAAQVDLGARILVRFSRPVLASSLELSLEAAGLPVEVGLDVVNRDTVELHPSATLAKGMPFTVKVRKATDLAGNGLATPYEYDFTSVATSCVRPGGEGGCFALLSTAVAASSDGESIAVAAGTYMDNVRIDRTLHVLGGYDDTLSVRDPSAHLTTIRGKTRERAIIEIISVGAQANATVLDGFTLTGNVFDDHGSGLRILSANPRVRNNVISGNTAFLLGGGVYVQEGKAHLARNRIEDNTTMGYGQGAGIAIEHASVELIDNFVVNNRVPEDGFGGGVGIYGGSLVVLRDNRIEGNHAGSLGLAAHGGGLSVRGAKATIFGGSILRNELVNAAGQGAAVYIGVEAGAASEVRFEGVIVRDNLAAPTGGAGGVHAVGSVVTLASSIIAGNRGSAGVALGPQGSYVIFHCTITGNTARGVRSTQAGLAMANSLVLQEPIGVEADQGAFTSNAFFANDVNAMGVTPGSSNLSVDPKLDLELHLTADSPLIDKGRVGPLPDPQSGVGVDPPLTDVDGDPRALPGLHGGVALPDIGADELRL